MEVLKQRASVVGNALMAARRTLKAADPSESTSLWGLLRLELVSYMTREIASAPADGGWWMRDKLPEWVRDLPRDEASVEAAMALLHSWGSFDPPGDVDAEEDDDVKEGED